MTEQLSDKKLFELLNLDEKSRVALINKVTELLEQLPVDITPILARLDRLEATQERLCILLQNTADLDGREAAILDLLTDQINAKKEKMKKR